MDLIASSSINSKKSHLIAKDDPSNWKICLDLINCTYQTFLGYLCLDACLAISLSFVGRYESIKPSRYIGSIENAGLGLAYTSLSLLVMPVAIGINQSLNIHTSQALGIGKTKLAKSYLFLNIVLVFLAMAPLCIILYLLKTPLSYTLASESRQETADAAWQFLNYMMPAFILSMEFECLKTFMVAHKVVYPFTFIHIITTCIHLGSTYLLVVTLEMGINGAGLAILSTEIFNLVGILIFTLCRRDLRKDIFEGMSLNIRLLKNLCIPYLKTSLPIIIHLYSEFFVFFLLSFVALSLDTVSANANLAIQNTSGICFRLPISLQLALMSFVGNEMGKKNVHLAKKYILAGVTIFIVTTALIILFLFLQRQTWVNFYTNDPEIGKILEDVLPWMCFGVIISDGFQGTINGALKGIEKQELVTYSTLIAYYVICIPVVFCFTYSWGLNMGVKGIWIGFGLANAILIVLYVVVLFTTNWERQAQQISMRVHAQNNCRDSKSFVIPEVLLAEE